MLLFVSGFAASLPHRAVAADTDSREKAARLWNAGVLYGGQGDFQRAKAAFEGCLKLEPSDASCKSSLEDADEQIKAGSGLVRGAERRGKKGAAKAAASEAAAPKAVHLKKTCAEDDKDCAQMFDEKTGKSVILFRKAKPKTAQDYWANASIHRLKDDDLKKSRDALIKCVELDGGNETYQNALKHTEEGLASMEKK